MTKTSTEAEKYSMALHSGSCYIAKRVSNIHVIGSDILHLTSPTHSSNVTSTA